MTRPYQILEQVGRIELASDRVEAGSQDLLVTCVERMMGIEPTVVFAGGEAPDHQDVREC